MGTRKKSTSWWDGLKQSRRDTAPDYRTGFTDIPPMRTMDAPPKEAEHFDATRWTMEHSKPSVVLPGEEIRWTEFHCPSCGEVAPGEKRGTPGQWPHGKTVHCQCGLHILCFGLGLNVWRDEAEMKRLANPESEDGDGPQVMSQRAGKYVH